ncbi:MAG: RNA-binding protein [Acidobacteriota bacterium]
MFVGNLNFETLESEVEALFSDVGTVVNVFFPLDRATGRPRGFAFVEFEDEETAIAAVEQFDGHELGGRNLRINVAEDRPPRERNFRFNDAPRGAPPRPSRPKGSRRGSRGKKRSL